MSDKTEEILPKSEKIVTSEESEKFPTTPNEKRLLEAVQTNDVELVKQLLKEKDVRVDCLDPHGTSPLQLAAFRGFSELCRLLLAHGADVNSNEHEHAYTTLMFAALSGNAELCHIFLEAGAKTYRTNKIGRTASELAAFTGQHHCVSVINNFLSLDDVEYYTKPQGTATEARLPAHFASSLHRLTTTYNIHPVKTILWLIDNVELMRHEKDFLYVLEDMMERQMRRKETNEVMAFKLHVIYSTIKSCFKFVKELGASDKSDKEQLLMYAKSLLAAKDENFPKGLEFFLRQTIREFPFHHSVLFQTMVRTLSQTPMGCEPTAASVMNQVLVGQRMMSDETFCATCGSSGAKKRCGGCKIVNYCSVDCQKLHWFAHKRWCPDLAKQYEEYEKGRKELKEEGDQESVIEAGTEGEKPEKHDNDSSGVEK